MAQRVTIRDIARLAGVSVATVSRVLNDRPDVDPTTRERIRALMGQLGYQPAHAAVLLARHAEHHRPPSLALPQDFLWGVATSALQIEGALDEDGRGPSIWDAFVASPPPDFAPQTAAVACDHYHRMPEDVRLLAQLGVNAYRFSVSWPRVVPEGEGAVNARGLDFYDRIVDELLAAGIAPLVTLYHWDLPLALQQRYGGWLDRRTAYAFADYAEQVVRRLGDRVRWWLTINEPWSIAVQSYVTGAHPPHRREGGEALRAGHHLLLAHGLAVPRIRQASGSRAEVGISLNLMPVYAADAREETARAVDRADMWHNRWFLDPIFRGSYPTGMAQGGAQEAHIEPGDMATIAAPVDFVGISYYSRVVVRPPAREGTGPLSGFDQIVPVPEATYSQMGWEIFANGLRDLLLRMQRDYHPRRIVVTENGVAFDDAAHGPREPIQDRRRIDFLREHITALQTAQHSGVPVQGYFVWTFMDNFEWIDGYRQQFGLVHVNRATLQRTVKESGRWYTHFLAAQKADASTHTRTGAHQSAH